MASHVTKAIWNPFVGKYVDIDKNQPIHPVIVEC